MSKKLFGAFVLSVMVLSLMVFSVDKALAKKIPRCKHAWSVPASHHIKQQFSIINEADHVSMAGTPLSAPRNNHECL